MTDVLRFSKKAFTVSVVGLTTLWSMGAAALIPTVANASGCVLEAGDLFKVKGTSAVYYLNGSLKRVPFFHGSHFKTLYQDYSSVVECDASSTSQYPLADTLPTTLNLRSGELWKIQSESAVYMTLGRDAADTDPRTPVCQVASEQQAKDWGFTLKTDVLDLPDYLNGNYRKTGMCSTPNGLLVSNPGSNDVYLVSEGKLVKVDGSLPQFLSKEVHVVATGLPMGAGSVTPAAVVEKSLPITGGSVIPAPVQGGALSVSLASDTPAAASVVNDSNNAQALIPVLKVNMVAAGNAVTVNSVKFTRGGISADTEINNAHLYVGDMWVASNPSISNGVMTFSNAAGLFTVAGGSNQSVTLKIDLKNTSSGGKSLNFALTDMSVASGSVAGLPLAAGQTLTTVNVTDLGFLTFSSISPSANATVDPGLTGYEVWRFSAASTDQDIELRRLRLTVIGSVSVGDLKNFTLWNGATQLGATVAEMSSDRSVTFDLSAAPFVVAKGQTKLFSVKLDIAGGTNRTFRVSVQNDRDLTTYDRQYKVFVKANGSDSFSVIEPANSANYTVNTGSLTQTNAVGAPTGNVALGATNVELGRFSWKANGEDVKVSSLSVSSTSSGNSLSNVRLLVNGSQVGSTITTLTADGAANSNWGTFGNSFIVKAGTSAEVKVVADLTHSSLAANDTIIVGLSAGSSNAQGVTSLTSMSSVAQTGSTLTVKSGIVTVAKNVAFGDRSAGNPTGPVNGTQVKVASVTIVGGAGEDVEVSQITLADDNAGPCIGTYMQNLTLKNAAGAQLGATYANPSSSCATVNSYTFNISPAVTVAAGSQYVVDVYADLKASLGVATSLIELTGVTASGKNTGTSATASATLSLQKSFISSVGTLTVAIDSDSPLANNLLMGAVDQSLAKFALSANNSEAINVSELNVSVNVSSQSATGTLRNIRLYDEAGVQVGTAVASADPTSAASYAHVKFSGLNLSVAKGTTKVLTVKADLTPYEAGGFSTTGYSVQLAVMSGDIDNSAAGTQYAVTATGAQSGTALSTFTFTSNDGNAPVSTATLAGSTQLAANASHVRGNEFVLYRAKLNVVWASDTPSGSSVGAAGQTIAKFVVTNVANAGGYQATVSGLNFNLSSTISNAGVSKDLTLYKDALNTSALVTTSFPAGRAINGAFGNTRLGAISVVISSGASKTFFVTLDTSLAASAKNLSVYIPSSQTAQEGGTAYGMTWSDGSVNDIVASDLNLPLIAKTLTY